MRNRTVLLVAVLLLGAAGGPAAGLVGAQQQMVTMTVSVVTAAGGPVSNAEVHASWDGGSADPVTTRSNGKALVDVPEGADVTVEIDHQFYVRNSRYTVTDASEREVEVTVWRKASATVSVVDADGPVEGVRVVFRKSGAIVGVHSTDSRGTVDSGIIESGEYALSFFKPGYLRKAITLTVEDEVSEEVSVEQASVAVEFLVLDDNFDPPQPVSEVTISGSDFSTTTQPDGRAGAIVPVNTELTVTVERAGYDTITRTVVVREENLRVNLTTRKQDAVQVELSNQRVVVGESLQVTVTDEYGEPLSEATVYLDGSSVGQPNAQGVLRVPIDSSGNHTLFAQLEQLTSERLTVTGIQSAGGDADGASTPAAELRVVEPAGFLSVPGVGLVHFRSVAIGAAIGLLIAAVLFLYVRLG